MKTGVLKYRKKPVVIEALLYDGTNREELKEFVGNSVGFMETVEGSVPYIMTLEGNMKVSEGDYVIKGVNGEFYPCKPGIFAKTYDEFQ